MHLPHQGLFYCVCFALQVFYVYASYFVVLTILIWGGAPQEKRNSPFSRPGLSLLLEGHCIFMGRVGIPHLFPLVLTMFIILSLSWLYLCYCIYSLLVTQLSVHLSRLPNNYVMNFLKLSTSTSSTGLEVSDWYSSVFSSALLHCWFYHTKPFLVHCCTQCLRNELAS